MFPILLSRRSCLAGARQDKSPLLGMRTLQVESADTMNADAIKKEIDKEIKREDGEKNYLTELLIKYGSSLVFGDMTAVKYAIEEVIRTDDVDILLILIGDAKKEKWLDCPYGLSGFAIASYAVDVAIRHENQAVLLFIKGMYGKLTWVDQAGDNFENYMNKRIPLMERHKFKELFPSQGNLGAAKDVANLLLGKRSLTCLWGSHGAVLELNHQGEGGEAENPVVVRTSCRV